MPVKKKGNLFVVSALALAALVVAVAAALPGHGQSLNKGDARDAAQTSTTNPNQTSSTKLTAESVTRSAPHAGADSAFASAAARNASLRVNLDWVFGGKQQRGWHLYTPLITRTLGTDSDAASPDFALAVSRWQQGAGLAPSGVLDNDTWFKMFSFWQSRRLKERAYPTQEQLVTAPAADFWDESRPEELRQVERQAYAAYKRMVAAAAADPTLRLATTHDGQLAAAEKYLKIISAFRSRAYQEQLRRQSPNSGRAGLAVNSPHFTGRALDIYVGGDPVDTKDSNRALQVQTPAYRWLVRNAERFGFRPYYYEPWHWEYIGPVTAATSDSQGN